MTEEIQLYADNLGEVTETSWHGREDMTYEEWAQVARTMQQMGRSLNWWIGDLLNFGERKWGETYAQAIEMTGAALETLKKYKAVAERVDHDVRRSDLSWTHHFYIAYLPNEEHADLLDIAARFELASRDFKDITNLREDERARLIEICMSDSQLVLPEVHGLIQDMKMNRISANGAADSDEQPKPRQREPEAEPGEFHDDQIEDVETADMVENYWESKGQPVRLYKDGATWGNISVRAVLRDGQPQLHWEVRI